MSLARKATIFGVAWFLIYILAYLLFLAPKFIANRPKSASIQPSIPPKHVVNTIHDPFVPDECHLESLVDKSIIDKYHVGVILVIHDENPLVILRTVNLSPLIRSLSSRFVLLLKIHKTFPSLSSLLMISQWFQSSNLTFCSSPLTISKGMD
jgi:hypothetical protein